jgi:4-amino-4-deoxy-L-arabinose transferase-like glycosyltransferase
MRYPAEEQRMQRELPDRERAVLGSLLVLAAAIRIAVNNVTEFSRADETIYVLYARTLAQGGGYRRVIQMFTDDPGMAVLPHPLRWSWIGASSFLCSITGDCTHHTLATLSTIAGIVAVALTWWIGRMLFGSTVGAVGAVFAATSPLQLALGRRALADEFFCMLVLASIAALIRASDATSPRARAAWLSAWVVATTLAIAAKEQFLFFYPFLLLYWWLRTRRFRLVEIVAWMLPPILFAGVFCVLAGDVATFFRIGRITTSTIGATYAEQFQSGPPHRLILDLLAISPIITLVAAAAFMAIALHRETFSPEHRAFAILVAGMFAVHAFFPSKNVRYIVAVDPLLRILVAAFLAAELEAKRWRPLAAVSGLLVNGVIELALFYAVFIKAGVYDPVTDSLLRALKMLPH